VFSLVGGVAADRTGPDRAEAPLSQFRLNACVEPVR